jgi:hypothetical protein
MYNKHGREAVQLTVLSCTKHEMLLLEQHLVDLFRAESRSANTWPLVSSGKNRSFTETTRNKMSSSAKKRCTPAWKEFMLQVNKAKRKEKNV